MDIHNAYFGQGSGPIVLHSVQCTGEENYLHECSNGGTGTLEECRHRDDAGVRCLGM